MPHSSEMLATHKCVVNGPYPQRHSEVRGDLELQQTAAHLLGQPHGVLVVVEADLQELQRIKASKTCLQRVEGTGCIYASGFYALELTRAVQGKQQQPRDVGCLPAAGRSTA